MTKMIYHLSQKFVTSDSKLSDIIFDNPYFVLMLEHFEIELGVYEKTIEQVCREKNIDPELFLIFSNLYNGNALSANVPVSLDNINVIIDFLKKSHDYYTQEKLPRIQAHIQQLNEMSGPFEISLVENFFNEYMQEIMDHLNYEADVVFPYILGLYQSNAHRPGKYSMTEYKIHHSDIESKLTDLKNLLIKYLPLKESRQTRRYLLFSLYELEFDLKIHTVIEDHLLIPLVRILEKQRKNKP